MGGIDLDVEQLCFRLRAKLRRSGADKAWIETELLEDGANLTERDRRFFQLQVNNVVIAIDLVAQTGNRFEFVIKFQDFIQIAQAGRVNFQFDHGSHSTNVPRSMQKRNDGDCAAPRAE